MDSAGSLDGIRARAKQMGIAAGPAPAGVTVLKGEWPGVQMPGGSGQGAGPTGVPWVDSNGWSIRLASARAPESPVWVEFEPKSNAYRMAIADCAAHGGRWIIALQDRLAAAIASKEPAALTAWKDLTATAAFFAAHREWAGYPAEAVMAVVSDFGGANEFFSGELLNLLARAGQHYRICFKSKPVALAGLRAAVYADQDPPSPSLRKQLLDFVQAGGLLITAPKWGALPAGPAGRDEHPRFNVLGHGKGRIAIAKVDPDDPYQFANDAAVILSHRHDLVRFWNGGATASYYTMSPDRKQAVVHLLFYANRGPDSASVRVAGRYRSGRMAAPAQTEARALEIQSQKDGTEVHLPQVGQYVALQLEV
jgi:hypothetical protein